MVVLTTWVGGRSEKKLRKLEMLRRCKKAVCVAVLVVWRSVQDS